MIEQTRAETHWAKTVSLVWLLAIVIAGAAIADAGTVTSNTGILKRSQIPAEGGTEERVFLSVPHLRQELNLCVPTSAAMVLSFFGDPQLPRRLKMLSRGLEYDPRKPFEDFTFTWWRDLIMGMKQLGYTWSENGFANTPEGFSEGIVAIKQNLIAGRPVLVDVALYRSHTLVIVGYDEISDLIYFNDPNISRPGIRQLTFQQFESIWNGLSYRVNARPILYTQRKPSTD